MASNVLKDRYVSVTDLAEMVGVHSNTIRNWVVRGVFPHAIKVGRSYRIPKSEIDVWQRSSLLKVGPKPDAPPASASGDDFGPG